MTDYSLYTKGQTDTAVMEERDELTILVVDDEPRICLSLKELLALNGYRAETAVGGKAAISQLKQKKFDLMLLDLGMPDVDGHQVMAYAREHHPHIDVIVVSGETSFDEAAWALQQGAQDFIRKPYAPAELLHAIEKTVRKLCLKQENSRIQNCLADSERRHRFFVESSPDIICMLDEKGCFNFVNERMSTLLGYSESKIIGAHYSMVVYRDDIDKAHRAFREQITKRNVAHVVELKMIRKPSSKISSHFSSCLIVVELSALSLYEEDGAANGRFLGTYGVIRDISERKRAEEIINHQVYHDVLTTLPNRGLLWDRMEVALSHARRCGGMLAVMCLNLDGFKVINDSLGHLMGDKLLQAVALRLRRNIREGDTLARVGGDEFNLLLPEISGDLDAAKAAEKTIECLKKPFLLNGHEIFIGVSIGIALFPADGENIETLIKNADIAMYHIKERGKNGYESFSANMPERTSRQFNLERSLRKALEENQFLLLFQPQHATDGGQIVGVEALIRWQHPEEGMILPGDFLPLAEETGLIADIGEWVLRTACAQFSRWCLAGVLPVKMAVNLSAAQLYRSDFVETVLSILHENQMPGKFLELEVTENTLMQDMEHVVQKLRQLTLHGVSVAVDDFGTGYSSLGYLQSLPLTMLKIDQSFVQRVQSEKEQHSILMAIVAMAKGLGLDVIAEGVETESQLEYLRSIDCAQAQGYLLGVPQSADSVIKWIATSSASQAL